MVSEQSDSRTEREFLHIPGKGNYDLVAIIDPATGDPVAPSAFGGGGGGGGGGTSDLLTGAPLTGEVLPSGSNTFGWLSWIRQGIGALGDASWGGSGNGSSIAVLKGIYGKVPVLGQAVAASSLPVVLPATQITALTPPTTITANIGTTNGLALDATLTGGTQQSRITDGTNVASVKAASTAAIATDKALVVAVSPNNTVGVTGTFWQATQPVSGTVTANVGTTNGLALDATLTGGTARSKITDGTNNAAVKAASIAAVATDPALVVAVSPNNSVAVTGTFWQATQPVSGTVTANIGTTNGIALDATLTGGTQQSRITDGTNVASVKAASTAAIATDKALVVAVSPNNTVGVTGTFWQATQPVSGTVTANIGTVNGLALDATLTGGTARSKITDGTNNAAVKAASTAAIATDPALVVAVSPNNTVAVTGTFWQTNQPVVGSAAANSTDSGSPVKIGGVYRSAGPTALTDGQRGDVQMDAKSNILMTPSKGSKTVTTPTITTAATVALAANTQRKLAIITNPSSTVTVYLGASNTMTTTAYTIALSPGQSYIDGETNDVWYAILGSGSLAINVTEVV